MSFQVFLRALRVLKQGTPKSSRNSEVVLDSITLGGGGGQSPHNPQNTVDRS